MGCLPMYPAIPHNVNLPSLDAREKNRLTLADELFDSFSYQKILASRRQPVTHAHPVQMMEIDDVPRMERANCHD